jgi:hypothetical protein
MPRVYGRGFVAISMILRPRFTHDYPRFLTFFLAALCTFQSLFVPFRALYFLGSCSRLLTITHDFQGPGPQKVHLKDVTWWLLFTYGTRKQLMELAGNIELASWWT